MENKSILDLYNAGEWASYPKGTKLDKTPLSIDGGEDIIADESKLEKARGGKLIVKKYSDSITNK